MLPDYIKIKKMVKEEIIDKRIELIMSLDPFYKAKKETVFEGNKGLLIRSDGTTSPINLKEFSSEIKINLDDCEEMSFQEILTEIDKCAMKVLKKQTGHFLNEIKRELEIIGNVTNAERELKPEHILNALDKILIPFNDKGEPIYPEIIAAPKVKEKIEEVLNSIENTPELKKKMEEIINRKRREWNDRENSRKLVG